MGNIRIKAIRIEASNKEIDLEENGVPSVLSETQHTFRIFGEGLTESMTITFTTEPGQFGDPCFLPVAKGFPVSIVLVCE